MASPEGPPGGRLAALVGCALAYMDRPWKAIVVILLVVLLGLGWAAWQERERLVELFTPEGHAALDTGALPAAPADLIVQTHADVAAVWSVDLGANAAHFEQGRRRGGGAWLFAPARVPAIVTRSDPKALVGLLGGDTVCDGLDNPQSLVMQRFLEEGMRRLCVTPIPPEGNLIGLLTLPGASRRRRPPRRRRSASPKSAHVSSSPDGSPTRGSGCVKTRASPGAPQASRAPAMALMAALLPPSALA